MVMRGRGTGEGLNGVAFPIGEGRRRRDANAMAPPPPPSSASRQMVADYLPPCLLLLRRVSDGGDGWYWGRCRAGTAFY